MSKISLKLCKFSPLRSFKSLEFRSRKDVCESCNSFMAKDRKVRELESQNVLESWGTLGRNHEGESKNF